MNTATTTSVVPDPLAILRRLSVMWSMYEKYDPHKGGMVYVPVAQKRFMDSFMHDVLPAIFALLESEKTHARKADLVLRALDAAAKAVDENHNDPVKARTVLADCAYSIRKTLKDGAA